MTFKFVMLQDEFKRQIEFKRIEFNCA